MPNLPLPPDYNPDTYMRAKRTEYGLFHESRRAARLAEQLLESGTEDDVALAHRVLRAVLACQERNPADPHYGNFYWMREDSQVEDLNAVEFVLEALIPLMHRSQSLLSAELRDEVLAAIHLGLDEIARLDVLVAYTNITALDVLNTCLGGELLGVETIAARGYRKLADWLAFTARSGHPLEYNSPTYTAVTLRALKELRDNVQHEPTRRRAAAMAARLALSVVLHIHRGTGRWAGPHSRAYQPSIVCETPAEIEPLRQWIADGIVPGWIEDLLNHSVPFTVTETAERSLGLAFSTYQSDAFALGVASRNFNDQNNVCMVHYRRPRAERPGVFYTRYLFDDKWFGDAYHRTDRTRTRNLPDEGAFFGVQNGPHAIGIYSPTRVAAWESAKAALIWTGHQHVDSIWVDGDAVSLPCQLAHGQTVVIASGDVFIAVRPLTVTPLCKQPPLQLIERDGDLVLELYNYRGIHKRFWELGWPGAFFQGHPTCAFYLEVAERTAHSGADAFARTVDAGVWREDLDPPFTYSGDGSRCYSAAYTRGDIVLGLELDLMQGVLTRRWTEMGDLELPMLDSPFARENADGVVTVGMAKLEASAGPAWLAELPYDRGWVVGYTGPDPITVTLSTPKGELVVEDLETGVVVWKDGDAQIDGHYAAATVDGGAI